MQVSKRSKAIASKIELGKVYTAEQAFNLLKDCSTVKFVESVEACINLGVDSRKSDQVVRGATVLPHGTGKNVRVAVFAQGENAKKAKAAGADIVGYDDLAADVKAGKLDFDLVIATPDAMRVVGQLGQILGPRGMMPNPKVGTVATDVTTAVKNAKAGQVQYRTDKGGIIHCIIGKMNFNVEALRDNLSTLLANLQRTKPSTSKGIYMKKVSVSSTMGPGIEIEQSSISL